MASSSLQLTGIELSFSNETIIDRLSLQVDSGEFFTLLGPSGCGKSSLLRLICGFEACQRGEIQLAGKNITHLPPWKRHIGMVFQGHALWPHMTVRQHITYGLKEQRLSQSVINDKVAKVLERVGLAQYQHRYPSQLSGGQQQRVALARTLVTEPKVLLLDEPFSNLDANLRVQLRQELRTLQQELQLTTIFVTHDQEEANSLSDRIALLNHGKVQQIGTPQSLYDRPNNLFVAHFIGEANLLCGHTLKHNGQSLFVSDEGFKLPVLSEFIGACHAIIRPHRFILATQTDYHLQGVIKNQQFLGNMVRYSILTSTNQKITYDAIYLKKNKLFKAGEIIYLQCDPTESYIIPK